MGRSTLKVVIPMAGLGTRLRPQTWSKPKQLLSVAGKPVLDHVLASLASLPESTDIELVNIVGYLGDQIEEHLKKNFPEIKSHFITQENPRGQSHALKLAEAHLNGPLLVVFADTLIETDLSKLNSESAEALVWVKEVSDPRRFGVAEVGGDGWVKRLIEKPTDIENNLAIVGFYYFRDGSRLIDAIDEQIKSNLQLKGEFFLADAVNILLEHGMKMHTQQVNVWLDAGTPEALLETNRYLLQKGLDNSIDAAKRQGIAVYPPVYIHPSAKITGSIIGPDVSIGAGCLVDHSIIRDSILEEEADAAGIILEHSLVGRRACLRSRPGIINVGDNTELTF